MAQRRTQAWALPDHRLLATVYLEDTDALGIVYHTNYLKYCERARTDILARYGYKLGQMVDSGCLFVVFEMQLRFLQPARLHDELEVRTAAARTSDYRLVFEHHVHRVGEEEPLFFADAQVVSIDRAGEILELPEGLLESAPV